LLADLVRGVADGIRSQAPYKLLESKAPRRSAKGDGPPIDSEDPHYHHSYASWKLFDYAAKVLMQLKGRRKKRVRGG